jgi:periplasmic divalent cation tolerance protein
MLESTSSARIVMTTVVSPEEGTRLGRTLVEERLAACATLLPPVHSIYRWQGKIVVSRDPTSTQDGDRTIARSGIETAGAPQLPNP